jgi:hypothetical protein
MDDDKNDAPRSAYQVYLNSILASSDAYAHLVRATSDICSARYHYYCDDEAVDLPEELVIVANTRTVPIRDNEHFKIGHPTGAIEAEPLRDKSPGAMHFVPRRDRGGAKAISEWKKDYESDIDKIDELEPRANFVCMSELGFPFGLDYRDGLELPPQHDEQWDWLQRSRFVSDRFVCLGSAHRTYTETEASDELRYENVAITFPHGKKSSAAARDVFTAKEERVEKVAQIEGVSFIEDAETGLSAVFAERITVNRRSLLSSPKVARVDAAKIGHAKKAFDFYESTAAGGSPPVYIKKKSPARKLGEYLDSSGKIELDVFVTKNGVVAVLICYDAFDPSIFLSAVRLYYQCYERKGDYRHQGIDIFFIPAFNRSQKFVDMCKVLSRETNSIVVYVSGDDRCPVRSDVFICGHPCEQWATEMAKGAPPETYYKRTEVPEHEHIHVHRFSKKVVEVAKRHLRSHASPRVRSGLIFGSNRLGAGVLG